MVFPVVTARPCANKMVSRHVRLFYSDNLRSGERSGLQRAYAARNAVRSFYIQCDHLGCYDWSLMDIKLGFPERSG